MVCQRRSSRRATPGRFARDLADFLSALYAIDPRGGPAPGKHSFMRGRSLGTYDDDTRSAIAALADELDATAATALWNRALASRWNGPPVWVHGDVAPSNLLVVGGRLGGVLDFGCCAVGDQACDLAIAWTSFSGASREAFRDRLALDEATWARGRGWALWKALVTCQKARERVAGTDFAAWRFGWRLSAREVVDEVLADLPEGA